MNKFFTQTRCDRCGGNLDTGRIISMYNNDCICMDCKRKETQRRDYELAREAEIAQVRKGNYNYKGIGLTD